MEYMTKEEKEIFLKKIFDRGTIVEFLPSKEVFRDKILNSKNTVRVKFGIDPTSPNIHIGRTVPLLTIRDLQDLGCEVVLIVGDFTGQIGDTSDKESERPMLSEQLVRENMKSYLDQIFKILRKENIYILNNSLWLKDMTLRQIGEISTLFSLSEFIARENIRKRLDKGKRISLRELFYPLMQGYDSFIVGADIEVGGTDQRFNMLSGREIQSNYLPDHKDMKKVDEKIKLPIELREKGKNSQCVLMNELLLGTDGRKMSSSWGNTINILEEAREMFGKIMRLPDELIEKYFINCTRLSLDDIHTLLSLNDPRKAKLCLAKELVKLYHGERKAQEEEHFFIETFSNKNIDADFLESIEVSLGETFLEVLVREKLAQSKGDARRKMTQGGVSLEGEKMLNPEQLFTEEMNKSILRVGKKHFKKVVLKKREEGKVK
ncbi:MAG: tyrosine--tRNA ligase [Candidatus Moranbacteria bacterium]|nr:tyrosine--tRNA ligase [Candidatus Moranbacteria bacterium]